MDIDKICPGCMKEVENRNSRETCPLCGYDFKNYRPEPYQLKPFTILAGKYLVGRVIGEGGFGISYLGIDINLELSVAIKEYYPHGFVTRESNNTAHVSLYAGKSQADVTKWRDGFLNEAKNLAKFSNLNGIVEVRDYFTENNTAYIVMEYIDGITLKQHLEQNGGKIPVSQTFEMMKPVIKSLAKVHDSGMIHRDISPDNIMITKYGDMKLLDFGAAREFAGNANKSLSIMLKPGYAPEEQYRTHGQQGPWSDVYAVTATIYKCITGVTPPEAMERMREDALKLPGECGISLSDNQEAAIKQGMAVYAENRLQDMDVLYQILYADNQISINLPLIPPTTSESESEGTLIPPTASELESQPVSPLPKEDFSTGNEMEAKSSFFMDARKKTLLIGIAFLLGFLAVIAYLIGISASSSRSSYEASALADGTDDAVAKTASSDDRSEGGAVAETDGVKTEVTVVAAQYGQNTAEWWKGFEADFEKDNAGIDLKVEVVSWNDIYTKVNTLVSNNNAPDILNIDVFADYHADDLLLPAKDYVSDATYAKMYDAFLAQSEIDGTVWAVPNRASARAMYYNKDILEGAGAKVPTTWDELKETCKKIKEKYPDVYPWGIDMTTDEGQAAFAYYIWNNGGDFTDADGNWTLNSDKNVEAIEYAISLVKEGYTNTDPANETRYNLQDMFGTGKVAMMIAPNSLPAYIKDGGNEVNYGMAAIPNNSGISVSAGVMDRFMCFDNGYTDEELAAITTFFDYFYDDARYAAWVEMEGFLPATKTGGEALAAKDAAMAEWINIVGSCKFYPVAEAAWADVKQGVIKAKQNALLGESVKEQLDNLQAEIAP